MGRVWVCVLAQAGAAVTTDTITRDAILRTSEVTRTAGLSRATLYRKMAAGTFPRSIPLTDTAVGWLASEVNAWIAERVRARDARIAA